MRVISGNLKGREILGYNLDGTRPTQDRVKESIFSSIQNYIRERTILDLFAGSGNLGIEAISNGGEYCYFVDKSIDAVNVINKNIKNFSIDNAKVLNCDYKKALNYFIDNNIKFDLVFIDPPYKYMFIEDILMFLVDNNLLNEDALVVCEYENRLELNEYKNLYLDKEKKYGYKFVKIFKTK